MTKQEKEKLNFALSEYYENNKGKLLAKRVRDVLEDSGGGTGLPPPNKEKKRGSKKFSFREEIANRREKKYRTLAKKKARKK